MTCLIEIKCPNCKLPFIGKNGFSRKGVPRYLCHNNQCRTKSFMLEYCYNACVPKVKEQAIEMAINGSGIRDTSRVLEISKTTVISTLKAKEASLIQVNPNIKTLKLSSESEVRVKLACDVAELDEQWSFVGSKSNQRWLWLAIDHVTGVVLAYVFGRRKDKIFNKLKALLEPFGIQKFCTDDWGAYTRNIDEDKHIIGKKNTQKIERKNLNFRTWIKRLTRKTICFSKLEKMHDIVIGLLINKIEFGVNIHAKTHI